jgi:SAM-dependent methyltransferase
MTLEELAAGWNKSDAVAGARQKELWDSAAPTYTREIPSFETHPFLHLVDTVAAPTGTMSVLDVGCGTGRFSLAFAPRVAQVLGTDISPRMIQLARELAQAQNTQNVEFSCVDWAQADLDALGLRGAYDLVFAHMTPAVSDFNTLDKLNACSRKFCFLVKPTRRHDPLQEHVFSIAGVENAGKESDDDLIRCFSYLWLKGYTPRLEYRQEIWDNTKTPEQATNWYSKRAELYRSPLSPAERAEISAYMAARAKDGQIKENITTTIVTLYWTVEAD